MKRFFFLAVCTFFLLKAGAQNFNYTDSVYNSTYSEINDPVILAEGDTWLTSDAEISVGFSFNYAGTAYQSLVVTDDGYIAFGQNKDYRFICFGLGLSNQKDSIGINLSSVSYLVKGDEGSRVLKIQFKNCKILNDSAGYVNFQVQFYEGSNNIGLIIGDTRFEGNALANAAKKIGLIRNSTQAGHMLTGDVSNPSSSSASATVSGYPATNTFYLFKPNF